MACATISPPQGRSTGHSPANHQLTESLYKKRPPPALERRAFPTAIIWAAWIALAAVCAVGLRWYRVANSMERWMPDLATAGPYQSYVVIGFPGDKVNATLLAAGLRALPVTAFCIDPALA